MAKEKHLKFEQETKDLTFYYEIVGIISLIIPVLAFARLGLIGFYIMLIFKIIFGDWYFLFLLTIFCYGLRCLIYHKPMNFKALRIIGIFLILVGVMMLSHFPMHKYIVSFDVDGSGGYFRKTIGLYLDYFKNYYDGMVVGGGILGSIFFYLFYSLFSSLGTIFMILVFEFVGIVFFTEKTIKDFLSIFGKVGIKVYNFIRKKFKSFKYDIVIPKTKIKQKAININELKEGEGIKFEALEHTTAKEIKEKISSILNQMNVFYNDIFIIVGYNVMTFTIDSIQYIDLNKLNSTLGQYLTQNFMLKKEVKTKKTIIEVNNNYDSIFDVRTALESTIEYKNNFNYPLAITSLNNIINIDIDKDPALLLEDSEEYSNNFINAFILMTYLKNPKKSFKIKLLNKLILDELINIGNKVLNDLNIEKCNSIIEYNNKVETKQKIKRHIIIIDNIDKHLSSNEELEKLIFLLQVSTKIGFFFIVRIADKTKLPQMIQNYLVKVFHFKNSINMEISKNIRNNEAFFVDKDLIERITFTSIENEEFEKFKSRI